MRIRSRTLYPVSRPPLDNGGLFILNGRIVEAGDWHHISRIGSGEIVDLGDAILLPGLINAHCHLDYTDMAGKISAPKSFPDWIKAILALKAGWSFSEYAASWLRGTEMLLRSGTTTVLDVEAVPELLPELWLSTPLRLISFFEMTGVKSDRPARQILKEAIGKIETLPPGQNESGLSPHALYSTKPDLLRLTAEVAAQRKLHTTMHLAESREEFEMYASRSGSLFDWLKNQREMSDCGNVSPVAQAAKTGVIDSRFLAVHVNYLGDGDAELLASKQATVVHCPSSHAYFGHDPFPLQTLKRAGVNVCLGTDSLASCKLEKGHKQAELNMFLEIRRFREQFPGIPAEEIIQMTTVNAAKSLNKTGLIGELNAGAHADFLALPFTGTVEDAAQAILNQAGEVAETWIAGKRVFVASGEA